MKAFMKRKIGGLKKKLQGIRSRPVPVCLGYSLGIFLATTPFIGLKVFIALILTSLFRWSKVASVVGVYHVNLFTAPLFYGLSFIVGKSVTGATVSFDFPEKLGFMAIFHLFFANVPLFFSLLAGGMILGIPMAVAAYFFSMKLIRKPDAEDQQPACNPDTIIKPCTLITGASQGLGREIAIECARRGQDLVLVALPGRNLDGLCADISRQFGIRAWFYETDLTEKEEIKLMVGKVLARHRVNFLINNAGTGGTVAFDSSSLDYLDNIIQLNIRALSMLTRMLIPELMSHPKAFILNVSSMAAFSPIPYKTVYPASKAFVTNFSRSLNRELRGTSVKVAVVHPGPIMTNPDVTLRIIRQGAAGKVGLLRAGEIARIAIEGIVRGHEVIVPGIMNKISLLLIRIIPEQIRLHMLSKVIRREISNPLLRAAA
jgi:uncharacterized protein